MQHGEAMKPKQIIKSISLSQINYCEKAILEYIDKFNIDFAKETKQMWFKKLGVSEKSRLNTLRERLETDLSREQKWKIKNEIKQIEELMNEH